MRHDRRELLELAVGALELRIALLELGRRRGQRAFRTAAVDGADEQLADGAHQRDGLVAPRALLPPPFEPHEADLRVTGAQRHEQDRLHAVAAEGVHRALAARRHVAGHVGYVHRLSGAQRTHPESLGVDGQLRDRRVQPRDAVGPPLDEELDAGTGLVGLQHVRAVEAEVGAQLAERRLDDGRQLVFVRAQESRRHAGDQILDADSEPQLGLGRSQLLFGVTTFVDVLGHDVDLARVAVGAHARQDPTV